MEGPKNTSQSDGDQIVKEHSDGLREEGGNQAVDELQNGGETQIHTRDHDGGSTGDNDNIQDNTAELDGDDTQGIDGNKNGHVVDQESADNEDGGLKQDGDSSMSIPSPADEDRKSGNKSISDGVNDDDQVKETVDEKRLGESTLNDTEHTVDQPTDNGNVTKDMQCKKELETFNDSEQKKVLPDIVLESNRGTDDINEQQRAPPKTADTTFGDADASKLPTDQGDITPALNTSLPLLTPGKPFIGAIPANDLVYSPRDSVTGSRTRVPPKFMRMPTVAMISRSSRPVTRDSTWSNDIPRRPNRGVTWSEAVNSRPPLRIDLEGPTPCTYSPRNKPLGETNAPSYTFGVKCQPEKNGGGRTSWWKAWFQTPHVWLNKVDFMRDQAWPSPSLYENQSPIGSRQASKPTASAFTIPVKKSSNIKFPGVLETPSPNHYSREAADGQTLRGSSSFTHGQRRGGTIPWSVTERTPGPGQYNASPVSRLACPAFTIQGLRREKSFSLGPFSTF